MTIEEQLDWLYRLRSEIYVYMPKEWLIPMTNALDMSIKALEQEPCEDAISRQAVNDAINDVIVKYIPMLDVRYEKIPLELITAIMKLPPVNPQPKIGHWVESKDKDFYKCSECECHWVKGLVENCNMDYCPNCGALMVEEQESEG